MNLSLIIFLVTEFVSGIFPDNLEAYVGQNCYTGTPNFIYNIFSVNPWPPSRGNTSVIEMYGRFTVNVYLQEQVLGTCYNNQIWNYEPTPINQTYQANEFTLFVAEIQWPTVPGSYYTNFVLTASQHITCWGFSYYLD